MQENQVEKDSGVRMTLRFDGEVGERLRALKQREYFDRPWTELIRYVLEKGLEKVEEE